MSLLSVQVKELTFEHIRCTQRVINGATVFNNMIIGNDVALR